MTRSTAHVTVLLEEAVGALAIKADGLYMDATFGRGGHSRRILSELNEKGRLIAVDRDPEAINFGRAINDPRWRWLNRQYILRFWSGCRTRLDCLCRVEIRRNRND